MLVTINRTGGEMGSLHCTSAAVEQNNLAKSGSPATVQSMSRKQPRVRHAAGVWGGARWFAARQCDGSQMAGRRLDQTPETFDFVSCCDFTMVVEGARCTLTSSQQGCTGTIA